MTCDFLFFYFDIQAKAHPRVREHEQSQQIQKNQHHKKKTGTQASNSETKTNMNPRQQALRKRKHQHKPIYRNAPNQEGITDKKTLKARAKVNKTAAKPIAIAKARSIFTSLQKPFIFCYLTISISSKQTDWILVLQPSHSYLSERLSTRSPNAI